MAKNEINRGSPDLEYSDEEVLNYHENNYPGHGKIEIIPKTPVISQRDLTLAYSPGVAVPCLEIQKKPIDLYKYTNIANTIAVISNGTRILGLGDIGIAGYPVMEGKSILFKALANVDAFPLILSNYDPDSFISTVKSISQNFAGINLEDIQKPDCFLIEPHIRKELDIPVFHDDQWGTAVVTLAGILNSLKLVDKNIDDVNIVMNGSGASGIAITHMLLDAGVKGTNIQTVDRIGTIYSGRGAMDMYKEELSTRINPKKLSLSLSEAVEGADILIGASSPGAFTKDMIKSMQNDAIVFAIANPDPEILPKHAIAAGATVVGTGRSDFPNQINNVLGFPGIFRGLLDVRAKKVTNNMKVAAANAIASMTPEEDLTPDNIITSPTDPQLMATEAAAVAKAAIKDNVARKIISDEKIYELTLKRIEYYQKIFAPTVKSRKIN